MALTHLMMIALYTRRTTIDSCQFLQVTLQSRRRKSLNVADEVPILRIEGLERPRPHQPVIWPQLTNPLFKQRIAGIVLGKPTFQSVAAPA